MSEFFSMMAVALARLETTRTGRTDLVLSFAGQRRDGTHERWEERLSGISVKSYEITQDRGHGDGAGVSTRATIVLDVNRYVAAGGLVVDAQCTSVEESAGQRLLAGGDSPARKDGA